MNVWYGGKVVSLVNPLLDLVVSVEPTYISKYGLKLDDAILAGEEHQGLYTDCEKNESMFHLTGGSGQNTLKMLQWLIAEPHQCSLLGCVGADKNGEILEKALQDVGINVLYEKKSGAATGKCAVLINGKYRSLVASLGACQQFSIGHLDTEGPSLALQTANTLYVTGYFINSNFEALIKIAKKFLAHDKLFILNLGAPFLMELFTEQVDELFQYADVIIGGREVLAYGKKQSGKDLDIHASLRLLCHVKKLSDTKPNRLVVITNGSESVSVLDLKDSKDIDSTPIASFTVPEIPEEEILDTNGAGDAFAAGFIFKYLQNQDVESAVSAGIKASSYIIKRSGFLLESRKDY